MHYTANDGDTAKANANYFANNVVKASAHYFVDDISVYRSVPDDYVAWSVGGGKFSDWASTGGAKYYGSCNNTNSLSIEMCDTTRDGKIDVSDATLKNAVDLCRSLMIKYNVPVSRVICHFDVNGKRCPNFNNGAWILGDRPDFKKFKAMLEEKEVEDMTKAETTNLIDNKLAGYGTEFSNWAKAAKTEEKAKAIGVTSNGERPRGYVTREEAMQMCIKSVEYAIKVCTTIKEDDGK